ncbi:MAG: hypothetical protein IJS69_06340 [Selenomonadaceae bacterium]|nr:hypothetical protein [Selenomonadaceae bacterium]
MFESTSALIFSVACYAIVALLGVVVIVYLTSRGSKKNSGMLEDLVLDERQENRDGYTSVIDKSKFLGKEGVCLTDLRPAGTINVDGEPLDVVTEGNFVKQGDKVKVINVDGSRVLVRVL